MHYSPFSLVPAGSYDSDNVVIRRFGEPPELGFAPRDHVEIGALLDGMDFEQAAKIAGSRFAVLGGGVARLHRALAQFMLDLHIGQQDRKSTRLNSSHVAISYAVFCLK